MAERLPLRDLLRRQGMRETGKERMQVQLKEV